MKQLPFMKKQFIFFSIILAISLPGYSQFQTRISGQISHLKQDTIALVLKVDGLLRKSVVKYLPVVNGHFDGELPVSQPTYFYLKDGVNYTYGLVDPGDDIVLEYDANDPAVSLQFHGKGSEKCVYENGLAQLKLSKRMMEQRSAARDAKYPFDYMFRFVDSTIAAYLGRLNAIRLLMSDGSYQMLKADLKASLLSNKYRSVGLLYHESPTETLKKRKGQLTDASRKMIENIAVFDGNFSYSPTYVNEVYNVLFMEFDGLVLNNKSETGLIKKYDYLIDRLPESLRKPVLCLFLEYDITHLNQGEDLEALIDRTYPAEQDSVLKNYLVKLYTDVLSFKKGMDAPAFEVENEQGKKVTLASLKGKVVLLDFWYGACGPCHALFESIAPVKQFFAGNDSVVFLCVSIDKNSVWKAALKKYGISGYHVYTENKEGNHPMVKAYKVGSYPTMCLIDAKGKIFMATPSHRAEELEEEIKAALRE